MTRCAIVLVESGMGVYDGNWVLRLLEGGGRGGQYDAGVFNLNPQQYLSART